MRLEIKLKTLQPLDLPAHYNSQVQNFIYTYIEPEISNYLHEQGFTSSGKKFKLFTFSRLRGVFKRYKSKEKKQWRIVFTDTITFDIASIDKQEIMQDHAPHQADGLLSLANFLLTTQDHVCIHYTPCDVLSVNIKKAPRINPNEPVTFEMLSPVTTHSTFHYTDGQKGTYYYMPFEKDWEEMLLNNLKAKAKAIGWDVEKQDFKGSYIKPINVTKKEKVVANIEGFWVEAWMGEFEMLLPEDYMWLAYKTGLGNRNSMGFGMIETA